tara:strand:+ start:53 stop:523 length:471 start_codon:yes stop_codon:yes gene_type:complete
MKTYKDLKNKLSSLNEGEETTGGAARSAHSDYGVHRIENVEQVGRLNAFLNAFTQMEFLDPKSAIAQVRHKFNLAGLDFKWNNKSNLVLDHATMLPLERWGGSFGTTPTHNLMKDGFYRGDNIKEFNGGVGLALKLEVYQEDDGLYQMDAKIVPNT